MAADAQAISFAVANQVVFTIAPNGKVTLADGMTFDEGVKAFCDAVERRQVTRAQAAEAAIDEIDKIIHNGRPNPDRQLDEVAGVLARYTLTKPQDDASA